jgi:hypothetical protein
MAISDHNDESFRRFLKHGAGQSGDHFKNPETPAQQWGAAARKRRQAVNAKRKAAAKARRPGWGPTGNRYGRTR